MYESGVLSGGKHSSVYLPIMTVQADAAFAACLIVYFLKLYPVSF